MRTIVRIIGFIFCATASGAWAEDTWHRCELPAAQRFIVITYMSTPYTFGVCFGLGEWDPELGVVVPGQGWSEGPPMEQEPFHIYIRSVTSASVSVQVLGWLHHEKFGRSPYAKYMTVPFDKSESMQVTNPQNVTVRYMHAG